jgi:signal transduction histidine kinase
MRERMSSIGGTCSIEPAPNGRGLVVTLELNLDRIRGSHSV